MENKQLAKSYPQETIAEHTALLKKNLNLFKKLYPALKLDWEILELAVLFHDLGKINSKFQDKLYRKLKYPLLPDPFPDRDEIPHGNISAVFLDRKKLMEQFDTDALKILYQSVYYHHARFIPDDKMEYFKEFIAADLPPYIPGIHCDSPFFNPKPLVDFLKYITQRIDYKTGKELFYRYVMVKGVLNRLDYAASAHIPVEVPNTSLEQKTLSFLKSYGDLREIQSYLLANPDKNHIVAASTGIGKTEAGLLWIGNNKGFFTLPLRVSIDAIYDRIKYGGIAFQDTALLHSDALAVMMKREEPADYLGEYTKARQLSKPLTITTVDQLFKFVFKEEGFESVLATLSFSKVIIDEIQMYSPAIVACILVGLKYIAEAGGKFTILTATFPDVLRFFLKKLGLTYDYKEFILDMKRHKTRIEKGDIEDAADAIIEKGKTSKVLVIVNTVKKAQALFEKLGHIPGKHLLHSRFIRRDRRELEKKILETSKGTAPGIWVTTQIVEASLDIDFDYLFTELSTVDGLFQRMGRCYRKRELTDPDSSPNVFLFPQSPSGIGFVIDRELFELSRQALTKFDGRVMSELDKLAVIKDVYSMDKIKETGYYKAIKSRINLLEAISGYEFDRKQVDENFRNIKSYTVIPLSIYNAEFENLRMWIEEVRQMELTGGSLARKMGLLENIDDVTVSVPVYYKDHIVEKIPVSRENSLLIIDLDYDKTRGLAQPRKGSSSNIL